MYDSILVPTDGSDHAEQAAEHATYLAGAFDATLHLINVVDIDAEAGPFSAGGVGEEFLEQLKADRREILETLQSDIGETDHHRTEVVTGRPSEAILDYVDDHGVDMIAMGTHGRTGVRRYVLGSVAERVVSLADCPVLTTRTTEQDQPIDGYDEVLIPTDGSPAAAAALDPGLAVASLSNARIHAVNVVHASASGRSELAVPGNLLSSLEEAGADATETVASQAQEAGLEAITDVRRGVPPEALLTYADEHDIDLIAMGTTGRTGLSRYLLGSTTKRVIRHAEQPVLSINARGKVEE